MLQKVIVIFVFLILSHPIKSWGDSLWGTLIWNQDNWYTIGDLNNDQIVNLTDAILALKVSTNNTVTQQVFAAGDINGDGSIGLEEAFHALQVTSGIRSNP